MIENHTCYTEHKRDGIKEYKKALSKSVAWVTSAGLNQKHYQEHQTGGK